MKRSHLFKHILPIVLLAMFVSGCYSEADYKAKEAEALQYQQTAEDALKEVNAFRIRIKSLETQLKEASEASDSMGKLKETIASLENQNIQLQTQLKELSDSENQLKTGNIELKNKNQSLSEELTKLKKAAPSEQSSAELDSLTSELTKHQLKISRQSNRLVVHLEDNVLFQVGNAQLSDSGKTVLSQIGKSLKLLKKRSIQIEGHSDTLRLLKEEVKKQYKSNLDLSLARASNVAHYLIKEAQVPSQQISVAGFGSSQPVASNRTAKGRQKNRRVELIIVIPESSKKIM
ncbi:MAG: OmpA family protein [SAR324 cluster bacterium]|nr:OmpA family protein [SAR324 cluster bacterium]MBF0350071.1 OmpA family protein [SAR324 cluster bacterium]